MGMMIKKGNELIRISPTNKQKIESSTNGGSFWSIRFNGSQFGDFLDITDNGKEILAQTTKGLYVSTNGGSFWSKRN